MSTPSTPTSTSTPTSSNESPADVRVPPPLGRGGRLATVVVMALGSMAMWLGLPVGLIYAASQTVDTTQPTFAPYLGILIGLPVGMALIGRGLGALDRWYGRRTGTLAERRRATWLKSMRDERTTTLGAWKILDVVMIWSVATALAGFAVWFVLFAGSSLPGT